MARPHLHDDARVTALVVGASRTRYLVMRQEDAWFITFNGEEFGPYQSEREAMLFAIDAAQKLGEYGDNAEVVLMGEDGHFHTEWSYGRDAGPVPAAADAAS
jgi:hypothetical protein